MWLTEGDDNTSFFYASMKLVGTNRIHSIKNELGEVVTYAKLIEEEVVTFYKNLFGTFAASLHAVDNERPSFE